MKNYSFLYKNDRQQETKNIIDSPFFEKIVDYVASSSDEKRFVKKEVLKGNISLDDITYRQEILKDFYTFDLYEGFTLIFKKYEKVIADFNLLKKQYIKAKGSIGDYIYIIGELLQDFCSILLRMLETYEEINDLLRGISNQLLGLDYLYLYVNDILKNASCLELKNICKLIKQDKNAFSYNVTVDKTLKYISSSISYDLTDYSKSHDLKKVYVKEFARGEISHFSTIAKLEIIDSMYEIFTNFAKFDDCLNELYFYHFGLNWIKFLKRNAIAWCYPKFSEENINFKEAIDPYLLVEMDKENRVYIYPYDIINDDNLQTILVVGDNNTGKTVFTRSILLNYIFGQAGLVISARSAELVYKEKIISCFSSEEKFTTPMGRFEKECESINLALDEVNSNTIFVMNEIFQSTTTKEGEEILYNILAYLGKENVFSIVVTHLENTVNKRDMYFKETNKELLIYNCYIDNKEYRIRKL